jgi:hypothetical protein
MTMPKPHVFLSYSHESEAHKQWVRRLAEDLTKKGLRTTLDQWDLQLGDDIGAFMEQSFKDAKYIVLICTEIFAEKANKRKGGVGYEQAVFVGEMLMSRELGSRFLPILRSGDPSTALPLYLRSRLFGDFRDDSAYEKSLEQLVRRVLGAPMYTPPELGNPPFGEKAKCVEVRPEHDLAPGLHTGAPQAWILVAGTGTSEWQKLDEKVQRTCIALGESLARAGYGVVTGGWRGVDDLTSRSFARELERFSIPLEDRLIQVVHRGDEEWTESVKRADAVVLIGGVGGTWSTGEYGLAFGRVVLPLADTGGDAAKFYMRMQRHWDPKFVPGIDRLRFQAVAREAPQVVAGLIELLDKWKRQKCHRT